MVREPHGWACAVTGDTRAPLYLCEQCANAKADDWNAPLEANKKPDFRPASAIPPSGGPPSVARIKSKYSTLDPAPARVLR